MKTKLSHVIITGLIIVGTLFMLNIISAITAIFIIFIGLGFARNHQLHLKYLEMKAESIKHLNTLKKYKEDNMNIQAKTAEVKPLKIKKVKVKKNETI